MEEEIGAAVRAASVDDQVRVIILTGACKFVFPSPTSNREQHMLDKCKSVAKRVARNAEQRRPSAGTSAGNYMFAGE